MNIQELFNVDGKTALITGGSRGIGEMIAAGFLANGVKVYITARKEAPLIEKAKELSDKFNGECIAIPCDLSNMEGIKKLASDYISYEDSLDILVNNAGAAWGEPYENFSEKGWDKVMDINLKSVFFLTQKLLPLLKKAGSKNDPARIINIASINGLTHPLMPTYSYSSSKSALIHLTRHLGADLAKYNININAIAPGFFPSKMTSHIAENESLSAQVIERIPIKRMGAPEDIAGTAIYLSSKASSWMCGETIVVDGGMVSASG